jgi:hypothetical protein
MSDDNPTPNELLDSYVSIYLQTKDKRSQEIEAVFGSGTKISRIDFENVISKLKSLGFNNFEAEGAYHLNIQNQFIDKKTGKTTIGNIRTTISGISAIQDYCQANTFDLDDPPRTISFMQKTSKIHEDKRLQSINYNDFGFRINYKEEKLLKPSFGIVKELLQSWNQEKKIFRLIKRFTFKSVRFPNIKVDCSIVRSSKRVGRRLIPEYRVESSDVFNNAESYEIEIELDALMGSLSTQFKNDLIRQLKTTIKYVLSGIQQTNFPISIAEQNGVLQNYMKILYNNSVPERRIRSRDFVGPSSISLERPNIAPLQEDSMVPNIRLPYTVTEKADGVRKLMMINSKGKIYLIDVNMKVQFTGIVSKNKEAFNTILDGEHVLHDKFGAFINKYLAFDIYYIKNNDVRANPFYVFDDTKKEDGRSRLVKLNKIMKNLQLAPLVGVELALKVDVKTFHVSSDGPTMFKNCKIILDRVKDDLFEYETDGLIFTPSDKGVGSSTIGETLDPVKRTWEWSFKWKPPEFNTIDFLVTTQKSETGEDKVGNIFQKGTDLSSAETVSEYKTLILRVGFDERRHGYINPCEDVIQDRLPKKTTREENSQYKPVPFYPSNPTPTYPAYLANIMLQDRGSIKVMLTENEEGVIENETIVECRYDPTRPKFWQWVPIRVRLDKTADYRSGGRNYGNAYHVAQSVWNSIHNPVTEEMITTGEGIPDLIADDDIYYNKKTRGTITRSLRDFHNLFVKRQLIMSAAKRGGTLIDMSVGKGGDFPKWIASKLSFVFGLDISRDNIENKINGTCARFLNYRKQFRSMPYALFVQANSSLNIRSTEACYTDKGKEITRAVFGDGPKDAKKLGKGVFRQYGKGEEGFDVVSNQFSIHYFFENIDVLTGFLRNVSECCKVGGYFIGTSYDGRAVFRKLEGKAPGESIFITHNGEKMWEIKKQYESDEFQNNISSLGYRIDVYQESINKTFPEYLVNFDYLIQVIENYGFVLLERDEARSLGLPESMGNFDQLFYEMQTQIKHRRLRASDVQSAPEMTSDEKKISFLNKYFIFKKVRDVNAEEVSRVLTGASIAQVDLEMKNTQTIAKPMIKKKPVVKKKKAKLKIGVKSTDVAEPVVEEMEIVVEKAPGKSKQVVKVKKRKAKVKVKGKKPVVVKTKGKVVVKGKRKVKIKKDDKDDQ